MPAGKSRSALLEAAAKGDVIAAAAALQSGDAVDSVDRDGCTALHLAAMAGHEPLVQRLLAANANVDAADRQGMTPLHFASREHCLGVVAILLKARANVDAQDAFGNTPLWRATFASRGRGEVIRLLRNSGADPDLRNSSGVSARELAATIANNDLLGFF